MRSWHASVDSLRDVCCLARSVLAASSAEAQQSSIGGVGHGPGDRAGRSRPPGSSSSAPNRIETTNQEGQYHFRNVAPGSYQVRVLRLGYRPGDRQCARGPGRDGHPRLRPDARPGAAGRDRDHRHRRAAQARDRQRGGHHRRRRGRRGAADHRVRQPALRPRGRGAGAQERRHHRHRHPHPDPGLQQRLALQRAAVLRRWHPDRRAAPPADAYDSGRQPARSSRSTTSIPTTSRTSRS